MISLNPTHGWNPKTKYFFRIRNYNIDIKEIIWLKQLSLHCKMSKFIISTLFKNIWIKWKFKLKNFEQIMRSSSNLTKKVDAIYMKLKNYGPCNSIKIANNRQMCGAYKTCHKFIQSAFVFLSAQVCRSIMLPCNNNPNINPGSDKTLYSSSYSVFFGDNSRQIEHIFEIEVLWPCMPTELEYVLTTAMNTAAVINVYKHSSSNELENNLNIY